MTLWEGIQHNLYKISKASEPAALNKYYCTLISPFFGMVCTMM